MKFVKEFKTKGFFKKKLNSNELKKLNEIKSNIISNFEKKFNIKKNKKNFFENFHEIIDIKNLNKVRVSLYKRLNQNQFNLQYYNLFSNYIEPIIGNENVVQKNINLSIQLPNDSSSLLPVHSDTWAGDSPFEIVLWTPLVDCKKTQSMFILPRNSKKFEHFSKKKFKSEKEIMKYIKTDITFINIKYGEILVFSQNLPHGNIINRENKTRWSFNARAKSLLSPYSSKGLIDFFDIVKILPATQFGLNYEYPKFK